MCAQERSGNASVYRTEPGKTCPDEIYETLDKYNVESRPIWKPMHLQPLYREHDFVSCGTDVGADIFRRGLCLPSDIKMTDEQQDQIIAIVRSCFK